ncbi:hypothetical protein Tco_0994552 [Tanacetum coccineum]
MSDTSSNHAEILAIHEASQECIWLRSVIKHIRESCGISSGQEAPTIIHEDNAACIAQLKDGYIKGESMPDLMVDDFQPRDRDDGSIEQARTFTVKYSELVEHKECKDDSGIGSPPEKITHTTNSSKAMSNLAKLEFLALDISGQNYLSWVLDAEIYLAANGLGDTIQAGKETTVEQKVKAMIFLRHHLHENLKFEYLTKKITDEEMLEKTFSTFHASNLLLQQQYRERGFKKYCDLISCLLVAKQNNELLMKNHESRPTRSAPLFEANMVAHNQNCGRGRGRGSVDEDATMDVAVAKGVDLAEVVIMVFSLGIQVVTKKWLDKGKMIKNDGVEKTKGALENKCYRCGSANHWARACGTPAHLVKLYQRPQKNKGKGVEVNFAYQDEKNDSFDIDNFGIDILGIDNLGVPEDPNDITHLMLAISSQMSDP